MAAHTAPGTGTARPTARKAIAYVEEFLGRIEMGDQPDLRGFIEDEVPAHLREEVFEALDRELADQGDDQERSSYLSPRTEVYLSGLGAAGQDRVGRWVDVVGLLVPWSIRGQLVRDVRAARKERLAMRERRIKVELSSARELLEGIAQRAPLCTPLPDPRQPSPVRARARHVGWIAWRLCGPAFFAGYLLGSIALVAIGSLLLLTALCSLTVVALEGVDELDSKQARFVNAVLGGTVAVLTLTVAYALVCLVPFALSLWPPLGVMAGVAVHMLVFLVTGSFCGITASGWTPEEWLPQRLVRV